MRSFLHVCAGFVLLFVGLPENTQAQKTAQWNSKGKLALNCDDVGSGLCADTHRHKNYEGKYVGHDEPAIIFYSSRRGSGSAGVYLLTLPKDPFTLPMQDGHGARGTSSSILRSGPGWQCATRSRSPNSRPSANPLQTPTSPTTPTPMLQTSSVTMRARRSWKCSCTLQAG